MKCLIDRIRPSNRPDPVQKVDELEKDEDVLRPSAGDIDGSDGVLQLEPDDKRRLRQVCIRQASRDVRRDVKAERMRFANGLRQGLRRAELERPVRRHAHRQAVRSRTERRLCDDAAEAISCAHEGDAEWS